MFSPTVGWYSSGDHRQGSIMGQVLHGSATTTHAVRAAIQRSKASIQELSQHYGINPKTVQKWRQRSSVEDAPMGPKQRRSTVLSPEAEAPIVAVRKHTPLPLDACPYAKSEENTSELQSLMRISYAVFCLTIQ